jgi:6-phosphogluconolactonase
VASDVDIVVAVDADAAARDVAERLVAAARAGGNIVITGGGSAGRAYELAAGFETDWSAVELWWSDERCVPPADENSNYGMAKTALLDRVSVGAAHRMRGELGREQGAEEYERELGTVEVFDFMLLGLGPDGHVASLFPEQPTLDETERRVIGSEAKLEPYVDRITLTLPVLRSARELLFLVTGENKADAAKRAFAGQPSKATPGSLVRAAQGLSQGRTTAVLDVAAAARL